MEQRPRLALEGIDALAILRHPHELKVVTSDELGEPVGHPFVDLDLQHSQIRVDDEPILSVDGEVEVAVSSTDAGVERDAKAGILFATDERLPRVTDGGAGSQIPLAHEALHFADD